MFFVLQLFVRFENKALQRRLGSKVEARFLTFAPVKFRRGVGEISESFFVLDLEPNH